MHKHQTQLLFTARPTQVVWSHLASEGSIDYPEDSKPPAPQSVGNSNEGEDLKYLDKFQLTLLCRGQQQQPTILSSSQGETSHHFESMGDTFATTPGHWWGCRWGGCVVWWLRTASTAVHYQGTLTICDEMVRIVQNCVAQNIIKSRFFRLFSNKSIILVRIF